MRFFEKLEIRNWRLERSIKNHGVFDSHDFSWKSCLAGGLF